MSMLLNRSHTILGSFPFLPAPFLMALVSNGHLAEHDAWNPKRERLRALTQFFARGSMTGLQVLLLDVYL